MTTSKPEPAERTGPLTGLLLSFGGLGYAPAAPGTVGSLATALLIYVAAGGSGAGTATNGLYCSLALLAFGSIVTLAWGGFAVGRGGKGDPGWVVSDEVAGQALASAAVVHTGAWAAHLLAFLFFRLLDITKPPPVRQAEALHGGLGVLLDDVVAGLMAALLAWGAWSAGLARLFGG